MANRKQIASGKVLEVDGKPIKRRALTKRHVATARWKIAQKLDKVIAHMVKGALGEVRLTSAQVSAARLLMSRVLPDLHEYELSDPAQRRSYEQIVGELKEALSAPGSQAVLSKMGIDVGSVIEGEAHVIEDPKEEEAVVSEVPEEEPHGEDGAASVPGGES